MGSFGFDGSDSSKVIDGSVGGLVWVRRRNGSWWPGRIMGLQELSQSCLVSPKSGTPVKLLGREDASIDWYNLEKSKRVKAFRCGEYDEFIEKAKASVAIASKRAVKYARREDAILQALELESSRLGKNQLAFSCTSGSEHGISTRNSTAVANSSEAGLADDMNDSEGRSDSMPELSQSGISFEENLNFSMARSGQSRRRTPNNSEDDGTEGLKQMRIRGIEGLGIGVVSKRKDQTRGIVELVREDTDVNCNLNTPNCLPYEHPPEDNKVSSSQFKRKRSLSNVNELSKRKNRCRQLTKVLETTTMVSLPMVCNELANSCGPHGGLSDGKLSELESNEPKKSSSAAMNNNSDSTVVSCENMIPENALDASHFKIKAKDNEVSSVSDRAKNETSNRLYDMSFSGEGKNPTGLSPSSSRRFVDGASIRQSSQAEPLCVSNELNNESGSTSSAVADPESNISKTIEKSSSKWQLKGKRNSRHTKKTLKNYSRNFLSTGNTQAACMAGTEQLDGFNVGSDQKVSSSIEEPPPSNNISSLEPEQLAEDGLNELDSINYTSVDKLHTKMKQLPDFAWAAPRSLPFRQSRLMVHSKYRRSEFSLTKFGCNASLYDVELVVKANYRPQHVPMVSLMSKLSCKAVVGYPLTVEVLDDGHCNNLLSKPELDPHSVESPHSVQSNPSKGKTFGKRRARAFQARPSRGKASKMKKSGQLSKKTRKLSSLAVQKQFVEESKPLVEKSNGSLIACIPLTVVFSRLNEALNRPTHCPLTTTASE